MVLFSFHFLTRRFYLLVVPMTWFRFGSGLGFGANIFLFWGEYPAVSCLGSFVLFLFPYFLHLSRLLYPSEATHGDEVFSLHQINLATNNNTHSLSLNLPSFLLIFAYKKKTKLALNPVRFHQNSTKINPMQTTRHIRFDTSRFT